MNCEKVEQGLRNCTDAVCSDECPYKRDGQEGFCMHNLHKDAIECIEATRLNRIFKRSAIGIVWLLYPVVLYKIFQLVFGR